MKHQNGAERVVIPIARGRLIKEKRRRPAPPSEDEESPTIRRLMQCIEMMAELTREVAKMR